MVWCLTTSHGSSLTGRLCSLGEDLVDYFLSDASGCSSRTSVNMSSSESGVPETELPGTIASLLAARGARQQQHRRKPLA